MQESINSFSDKLIEIESVLEKNKSTILQAEQNVFGILEETERAFALNGQNSSVGESDALRDTIRQVFSDLGYAINRWKQEMAERSEVRKKLEDMGSGLIVAVFGRTNAGKSTLGNFLRGKQLREAQFDNAWKSNDKFLPSKITVIERSSDTELTSDDLWFAEGGVETTREAQMFRLPGLLWLDTPGFGSVNDKSLGALARKYVKRADLIIYLDDSDNPGLKNITSSLVEILSEGRCTLVAINHSDINDYVRDENGNILKDDQRKPLRQRVAKTPEVRALQEEYLTGILRDKLPKKNSINAISISMLLAKMGIKNNNEKQYFDSNINLLFSKIIDLIPDNTAVTRLKYQDAIQNCIVLIDMVAGNSVRSSEECNLQNLDKQLADLEARIIKTEKLFNIQDETKIITAPLLLRARQQLHEILQKAKAETEKSKNIDKKTINLDIIIEQMNNSAEREIEKKAVKFLNDLWIKPASEMQMHFPKNTNIVIERKTEIHTYEVTETESYARSPDGILENICSFFGKRYYSSRLVTRQKEQIIDLGFNIEEVFKNIIKQLEDICKNYVEHELAHIREECLVNGLKIVREHREVLTNAKSKIEALRQALEKEKSCDL